MQEEKQQDERGEVLSGVSFAPWRRHSRARRR